MSVKGIPHVLPTGKVSDEAHVTDGVEVIDLTINIALNKKKQRLMSKK